MRDAGAEYKALRRTRTVADDSESSDGPDLKVKNLKKKIELELFTPKTSTPPDTPAGRPRTSSESTTRHGPRAMLRRMMFTDDDKKKDREEEKVERKSPATYRDKLERTESSPDTSQDKTSDSSGKDSVKALDSLPTRATSRETLSSSAGQKRVQAKKSKIFNITEEMGVISESLEEATPKASDEEALKQQPQQQQQQSSTPSSPTSLTPSSSAALESKSSHSLFQIQKTGSKKRKEEEKSRSEAQHLLASEDSSVSV